MWSSLALPAVALVASFAQHAAAQVHSDCNPMNGTVCPPNPALGTDFMFNFNATPSKDAWETHVGPVEYTPENGATFTIRKQGDSPTIRSKFYFFGGRAEIHLKAAHGAGIVSSVMLLSDTLDEVDWEWVGVNNTYALSNYFGKGKELFTEGAEHLVPGAGVFDEFHNYTTVWTETRLEWFVDGQRVRVLDKANALENGNLFPQTPMRLYLGIWAGGDPRMPEGTREWAGGDTDYAAGPYSMHVKQVHVTDFSTGKEYTYGDDSGMWESIKIVEEGKNSTIMEALYAEPEKSIGEKFNELPAGAKYGIYGGGAFVIAALLVTLVFYIIRQRRRGAEEAQAAEKKAEIERLEDETFKKTGRNPDEFAGITGADYNPSGAKQEFYQETYDASPTANLPSNAAAYGVAGAAAGAAAGAGAYGAMRSQHNQSPANSYHTNNMRSHPGPPPGAYGASRSPSSPGPPPGAFGANRSPSSPGPPSNAYGANRSASSPAPSNNGYNSLRSPASPAPSVGGYGAVPLRSPSSPVHSQGGYMRSPSSPAPSGNGYGAMRSPASPAPYNGLPSSPAPPSRGPQTFGDMNNMGNNGYYR
ncbi:concanavalin A-like lectin/glucanase domain-containing protein [Plectosphaerella plurivora]|uniref:chitinase n=1 Tax=Plectosphaerella plurivora TaxID=936078 RepID=A0A9P8V8L2_9PEZI|nr:concanavalin A-like lectin/glucanase domain-containing protein [Plectosphaerella plurivora]